MDGGRGAKGPDGKEAVATDVHRRGGWLGGTATGLGGEAVDDLARAGRGPLQLGDDDRTRPPTPTSSGLLEEADDYDHRELRRSRCPPCANVNWRRGGNRCMNQCMRSALCSPDRGAG